MKKKTFIFITMVLIVFVAIPLLMDNFLFGNNFSTNLDNSEWSGFLGSYVGSLIGAIATIAGVRYGFYLDSKKQIESEIWENSLIVYYDLVLGLTDLKKLYISLYNVSFTNIPTKMFFSNEWIKNVAKISGTEKSTEKIYKLYGDLVSVSSQLELKNQLKGKESNTFSYEAFGFIVTTVSQRIFSNNFLDSAKKDYLNVSDISLEIDNDLNEDIKLIINNLKDLKEKYNK